VAITVPADPTAPVAPPKLWKVLAGVFITWLVTLALCYLISPQSLTFAVVFLFLIGFPLPTYLFYRGRVVVSKRIVKALDYLTILTFLTGMLAITEIDAERFKERADRAASRIGGLQRVLQEKINARLELCGNFQIKPQFDSNILSAEFIGSFLFCRAFSDLRGVELDQLSEQQFAQRSLIANFPFFFLSREDAGRGIVAAWSEYRTARNEVVAANPFAFSVPKTIAYLLVAFAFAVRLTRTTLEVFEWHAR
jgi:hypothetical protein